MFQELPSRTEAARGEAVRQIVRSALDEHAGRIDLVPEQGNVNRAYEVETRNGSLIVRVRFERDEMRQFLAEKCCADLIRREHDWTPAIIAVGRYENHCYSIQEKVQGTVASQYQGELISVWEQVGQYSSFFHGIKTSGYIYELFDELPSSNGPWCQWYFDYLGQAKDSRLVACGLLTHEEFQSALETLYPLKDLKFEPHLAHGNLSPKNLIVDFSGRAHIIDWGTCQGHLATELDLAELLVFDTPEEHVKAYMRGHSLPDDYIKQNQELLTRLQLARAFVSAHWLIESRSMRQESILNYVDKVKALIIAQPQ